MFKAGESAAVLEETRTPLPEGTALAAGIDILVGTLGSATTRFARLLLRLASRQARSRRRSGSSEGRRNA